MKMLVVAMGAMFAVSACGKKEGEAAAGGAAAGGGEAGGTGVEVCDKLVANYEACLSKLPDAAKGAAQQGLDAMKKGFKEGAADKGALETACKAAVDQMKGAMGAMCPDVKWD
jgi:hypothetical protein